MSYDYDNKAYKNIGIDFEEYMNQFLYDFLEDYPSREEYMAEFIIPVLKDCCPKGAKVIPVYADRNVGPQKENSRMETISAVYKKDGKTKYVVPDFLIVPKVYSYENPVKPLVMIETKKPQIFSVDEYHYAYRDVLDVMNNVESIRDQVQTELKACDSVILTDGITWAFLGKKNKKIVETGTTVRLLDVHKTDYIDPKTNRKHPGYKITGCRYEEGEERAYDPSTIEDNGWHLLKDQLFDLISDKLKNIKS